MSKKKVVALSLTDEYDQRLDEIAQENADLVGRTLKGTPNRSEIVRALIDSHDPDALRAFLAQRRQQAA